MKMSYSCDECSQTFAYAVSVQKHKILNHRKIPKPKIYIPPDAPMDRATLKKVRVKTSGV